MTQPNFIDETGNKYGKLTVIERVQNTLYGTAKWLCQCECGNTKECRGQDLRSGRITHCGCENKPKRITNYFRIKNMSIDKMARFLTKLHCQECCYQDDWRKCNQIGCWCHENNNYQSYSDWLLQEVEE